MPLKESLSRWKNRLKKSIRKDSPQHPPELQHFPEPQPNSVPQQNPAPQKDASAGLKSLLKVLESESKDLGPLKSTIDGLNRSIDICRSSFSKRRDYDTLWEEIDGLMLDLAHHLTQRELEMTDSVRQLCHVIQVETTKIEGKCVQIASEASVDRMEASDQILECYRCIHGLIERVTLNATLQITAIDKQIMESRLQGVSPSISSIYNSAEADRVRRGSCMPGTRAPQIDMIVEWSRNPEAGKMYWMNGMAGTGKTTIAYSACTKLDESFQLGASFFCSRVIPECRQVRYIIPTIAYQLARYSLPFRYALNKVLESNPDAHARALKYQYEKLIVEPSMAMRDSLPTDLIIVIDALDECEDESDLG